jgi:hypothetical protein
MHWWRAQDVVQVCHFSLQSLTDHLGQSQCTDALQNTTTCRFSKAPALAVFALYTSSASRAPLRYSLDHILISKSQALTFSRDIQTLLSALQPPLSRLLQPLRHSRSSRASTPTDTVVLGSNIQQGSFVISYAAPSRQSQVLYTLHHPITRPQTHPRYRRPTKSVRFSLGSSLHNAIP